MQRFISAWTSIAGLLASATSLHAQTHFTARLTGNQILPYPGVVTTATGTASLTLTSSGLQFSITVEGLSGPIQAATIEQGAPGLAGPVVRDITTEFGGQNTAAGLWSPGDIPPLTSSMISELTKGNLYITIYTAAHPLTGELRGQIQLSAGIHLTANLQSAQVSPTGTGASGTGTASFTLTDQGLIYKVTVNDPTGPISPAHIHTGGIGQNGPITFAITFVGNHSEGILTGLTPTQRRDLIAGNMYLNLRTAAFPAGELRGQIQLAGGLGLSARLDGGQMVPPTGSPALGTASATLTAAGLLLDLTGSQLTGSFVEAHIHRGAPGVNGPAVRSLLGTDILPPMSWMTLWRPDDSPPLTPELIADLLAGNLYVDIHTFMIFGNGEIRGQLILNQAGSTSSATYLANLAGLQVVPRINTSPGPPIGTGTFQLVPGGLLFRISIDDALSGPITSGHIHNASIGLAGGSVRDIGAGEFIGSRTVSGLWSPADPQPFTPGMATELIKGNLYFDAHTAARPGGEVRGQLEPTSGAEFEAQLTGPQETPPNVAAALGRGSFTLTPYGLNFNITCDGLSGPATGASFHNGSRGISGGMVRAITPAEFVTPNTLAGVWKPTDAQPLTPALVTELLKGNLYVDIQTALNPGGETRGQLMLSGGFPFAARLNGPQEVPPNASPGKGTSAMTLTDEGHVFRFSSNDMMALPTSAELGQGSPGVNGPVLRPIDAGETITSRSADGVWKASDADPLTTTAMGSLFRGQVYLDVNSEAFPTGEIRGQLGWPTPTVSVVPMAEASGIQLLSTPNPARERTTISFHLPRREIVRLALYDVTGAEVAELAQGSREAGWTLVSFDVSRLSSGMYFTRLTSGSIHLSGKLMVLR